MKPRMILRACFLLAAFSSGHAQVVFQKITTGELVNTPAFWVGGTWADFDGDGLQDVLVCNYGPDVNGLFLNNGDGTFKRVIQGDPVQDVNYHVYAVAGDYNNDGTPDLYITAAAFSPSATANQFYKNNGGAVFSSVSGGTITNHLGHFGPASWGDYDRDGYLDLFVANHGDLNSNGGKNLLYHSNGDGTFSNVVSGAIVNDIGIGFAAGWIDYDGDGWPDLLVINQPTGSNTRNFLYHNNGNGTFTRITNGIVATDTWSQGATCGAWGDYDNDGFPDLFVTDSAGIRNQLYHNDGKGGFTRVTSGPELLPPQGGAPNGCSWGDYDNDGYLDLFVSGSHGTNALFHNNGDGTFSAVTSGDPVQDGGPGIVYNSVSWVDYDNDGFLDLFVTRGSGSNLLFHNGGNTNGWMEVKLVGTVGNRSAIGAKVRLHASIGGKAFWQLREINGGCGYDSKPLLAHFGLGDATNVDTLRIEWPSGTVQELHNIAPKQILTITEPPLLQASISNAAPQIWLKSWPGLQYNIEASGDLTNWSLIGNVTVTNASGMTLITDTNTPTHQFYRAVSR